MLLSLDLLEAISRVMKVYIKRQGDIYGKQIPQSQLLAAIAVLDFSSEFGISTLLKEEDL